MPSRHSTDGMRLVRNGARSTGIHFSREPSNWPSADSNRRAERRGSCAGPSPTFLLRTGHSTLSTRTASSITFRRTRRAVEEFHRVLRPGVLSAAGHSRFALWAGDIGPVAGLGARSARRVHGTDRYRLDDRDRYPVRVSMMADGLGRFRKRAIARLRGTPVIDRLVAQGLELGVGTHISDNIYVDGLHPWLITIEDHVTLAPFVSIITHDASLAHHTGQTRLGRVVVGKRAYIGVGAILLPGTTIGEDSVVSAGAVVHGEIPPASLVMGNPAKVSPLKPVVAWQLASAKRAPKWPSKGWTMHSGITEERKCAQREALASATSGYVPAHGAPGSPHALRAKAPPGPSAK